MSKKHEIHSKQTRVISVVIAFIISAIVFALQLPIGWQEKIVLSITLFAGILWFTEAIPLFVTALLVPFLLIVFAGLSPKPVFTPFFDPIIALLFGGFILARAIQKYGLDKELVQFFVKIFGTNPKMFLLGLMFATALLSMWISNTATAALMIPIGVSMIMAMKLKPFKSNYSKAMILGIGYSATVGGIGSLIGTPPNAIAVKYLADYGVNMYFLDWVVYAFPLMIVMVFVAWFTLTTIYKPEIKKVKPPKVKKGKMNLKQKTTLFFFILTAFLWITQSYHGVHYSAVAMIPVIGFYSLRLLGMNDLYKIHWDALILVGGGLALGGAIVSSGLDQTIASALGVILLGQAKFVSLLILGLFAVAFTAFVANTAGAAILIPVMIPLASSLGLDIKVIAIFIGIVVSFDFIVPVGTPPNAIAYSSGYIRVKDMVRGGILISVLGVIIASIFAMFW